ESRWERAEDLAAVGAGLAALAEPSREVLVLYYEHSRSTAELAAELGIGEPAVRKRLSRAREALRAEGGQRGGEAGHRNRPRAAFVAAVLVAIAAWPRVSRAGTSRAASWAGREAWIGVVAGGIAMVAALVAAPSTVPSGADPDDPRAVLTWALPALG